MSEPLFSTRLLIDHEGEIALLRRVPTGEFKGSWELPGGKVDPGESIVEGALREGEEETGLDLELINYQGLEIDSKIIPDGKHKGRPYHSFGFAAVSNSKDIVLKPEEHEQGIWVPYVEALTMPATPTSHLAMRKLGPLLGFRIE